MLLFDVASSTPFIKPMPWADPQSTNPCSSALLYVGKWPGPQKVVLMSLVSLGNKNCHAPVSAGAGSQGSTLLVRAISVTRCAPAEPGPFRITEK